METAMNTVTDNPAIRKGATLFSFLTHPLLMPLAAVAVLFFGGTYLVYLPPAMKRFDLTLVFLNTILIPLFYMHVLHRTGTIQSYYLTSRRERLLPIALYTLLLLLTWLLLRRVRQPSFLTGLFLALTLTSALTGLLTLRWKISLHMAGVGSLSALLLATALRLTPHFIILWLLSLLLAGLTATARLLLQHHTPTEVYSAFLLAFATTLLILLL